MARAYSSRSIARVLFVRQSVVKGVQGGGHALGEVPFPLRSDADAGERTVGSLLVDAAFQCCEDGNAHGDQPAAQAPEGTVVLLLGLADFGGEFQHGGFVEARSRGQGGAVALGEFGLHTVEGFDVGELESEGLLPGVAHDEEHEAVAMDDVHGTVLGLFVEVRGPRKIAVAKQFWAVSK